MMPRVALALMTWGPAPGMANWMVSDAGTDDLKALAKRTGQRPVADQVAQ